MEIHHHSHSPAAGHPKKWTHYFWEFIMLFLAVTLGFLAENIREHAVEKHRVKQYARSLIFELEKDTSVINLVTFRINRYIRMTDTLAAYLRQRPYAETRNISVFILSAIDRYPPYIWNRATIEQLKNSGSLRYFSDDRIVRAISMYDAQTHHMDEDQQADDGMANTSASLREQVVDMDYPMAFTYGLRNNIDSMLKTHDLQQLVATDQHKLIAKDLSTVRIFLNSKLNLCKHLMIRTEDELPKLKQDAVRLITLLKKEFHLE